MAFANSEILTRSPGLKSLRLATCIDKVRVITTFVGTSHAFWAIAYSLSIVKSIKNAGESIFTFATRIIIRAMQHTFAN